MSWRLYICLGVLIFKTPLYSQSTAAENAWKQFRSVYPYHIQVTAITAPTPDGTRVLIISEPPPHISMRGFVEINPALLSGAGVQKQKIGYNGWLKDIVVKLPPMEEGALRELLDRIHDQLFGTTYKASTIALPAVLPEPASPISLDVQVTTADLNRWLIAGKLGFTTFGDGTIASLPDLLKNKKEGAYLSVKPGMAALVLPRAGDYARFSREIRHFALDSDVIVGAVASTTHVAIVARERVIPATTMPPLRTETVLQLAGVRSDSLEQSYQRLYILAGKFDREKNLDWAPIYLSDVLIDTEYGSLLNLTDQLLKSWSMAGKIEYVNFPYPKPDKFPFDRPLSSMPEIANVMKENDEGLTFNWNTNGAGYVDSRSDYRIYALNRTGALPISYLSGGANASSLEKDAYRWFAERTRDPNLARVVQYAALYQIFHEFRIYSSASKAAASRQPNTTRIAGALATAIQAVRTEDCDTQSISSHGSDAREFHRLMHLLGVGDLEHSCDLLGGLFTQYGASGLSTVAAVLAAADRSPADTNLLKSVFDRPKNERDSFVDSLPEERRRRLEAIFIAQELASEEAFRHSITSRIPLDTARQWFVAGGDRPETSWIGTASIVISHPTGEVATGTGGHNLDANIGRFVADDAVKPGEFRVVREGANRVVHYSPADSAHLPDWLRGSTVDTNDAALVRSMKSTLRLPVTVPENRALSTALGVSNENRPFRGLDLPLAGKTEATGLGWGNPASANIREAEFLNEVRTGPARVLRVERLDNGYYRVLIGETNQVYQARSMTDVVDSVASSLKHAPSPPPTSLMLAGFDDTGAINLRRSVELKLKGDGISNRRVLSTRLKAEATPESMFRRISEEGDLSRARFGEWQVKDVRLASGKEGKVFETTIDVPPKVAGIRGFFLTIRVFFESLFPGLQRMTGAQDGLLLSLSKLPADARVEDAAAAVEKELRIQFPNLDSVVFETANMTISHIGKTADDSAN